MLFALRIVLAALGVMAIFTAASMLALGARETMAAAEGSFGMTWHMSGAMAATSSATVDSQLRFYAAFWGAYGVLLLVIVTNTEPHLELVPWLAAVMFAGGVGRAISYVTLGPPHPFFTVLMVIELLAPPAVCLLWWGVQRGAVLNPCSTGDTTAWFRKLREARLDGVRGLEGGGCVPGPGRPHGDHAARRLRRRGDQGRAPQRRPPSRHAGLSDLEPG